MVIGLTLATMVVGAMLASPAWKKIAKVIEQGDDLNEARQSAVRFQYSMAVEHILRIITLLFVIAR